MKRILPEAVGWNRPILTPTICVEMLSPSAAFHASFVGRQCGTWSLCLALYDTSPALLCQTFVSGDLYHRTALIYIIFWLHYAKPTDDIIHSCRSCTFKAMQMLTKEEIFLGWLLTSKTKDHNRIEFLFSVPTCSTEV